MVVVSGEASRLGLKHCTWKRNSSGKTSGQWRGFPPGIETYMHQTGFYRRLIVVSGEASRLGLKHRMSEILLMI